MKTNHMIAAAAAIVTSFWMGHMPASAQQADHAVRIQAGNQVGGGYTISNGAQCFIVTARHVIADEVGDPVPAVTVINSKGMRRSARPVRLSQNHDLALYKIEQPSGFNCAQTWNNGSAARQSAQSSERLFLIKTDEQGNAQRIFLDFARNDGDAYFHLYPRYPDQPEKRPRAGDSGSPVFAGITQLVGIAQDVNSATGDVTVISQKAIDSEFAGEVVSAHALRLLVSQVTQKRGSEHRVATLSLLDALEAQQNIVVFERNRIYSGTSSWRGNISPQLARRSNLPAIPDADYLLEVDIVDTDTASVRVPKYPELQNSTAEEVVVGALLGSLLGDDAQSQMERARRERERKKQETKTIMEATADLEFRLTDTRTGRIIRHRERLARRVDTTDWRQAQDAVLNYAITNGTQNVLTKAGF